MWITGQWISGVAIPDCCQQKGKAVALHAKQVQRGGQGTALAILNPSTKREWVVSSMTRLLHPHETDAVSTVQECRWASGPAWIGLVNLTPPEFELLTLQSVGRCYIYYVIPPPLMSITSKKAKQHQVIIMLVAASSYSLILCWSWLSLKLSSIPSRLWPLHANFLFSLSSKPLQPHHSNFFVAFLLGLFFRSSNNYLFWQFFIIHIISFIFPSVDPYRITKSKWIWKSSHFGKLRSKTITKLYNNNKIQYNTNWLVY